jgi:tRNA pseudouridine55 synthase
MNGVIVVDKPAGWTSHDVVNKVRHIAGTRVGHMGTLDPLATGVLPLLMEKATRLAQFFRRNDKVYEAVIRFGVATTTYDAEGTALGPEVDVELTVEKIEQGLQYFRGRFLQVPPAVSAKKVGGVRAYKLARKNIEVKLPPVEVETFSVDLLHLDRNEARIRVHCSAGTYLRSIAHDLGADLGCGAHIKQLRRTASGYFGISLARTLEALEQLASENRLEEALIPSAELLPEFPSERVDALTAGQIRQGRDFRVSPFRAARDSQYVKAISLEGDLVAIAEVRLPHLYHPILVL